MNCRKRATSVEKARFIHDGPQFFPNSVVLYTRFESAKLRQMFAYLREKEQIMQADLVRDYPVLRKAELKQRLIEVESQLIFMVANFR
jgi:hypothetical protein